MSAIETNHMSGKLRHWRNKYLIFFIITVLCLSYVPFQYPPVPEVRAAAPSGVIVAWPSTAASIPSGWSRVTALDTYFLEGTTSNPSASAQGNANHTHTSPTHQHTLGGHTHTGTTGAASGSSGTKNGTGGSGNGHTHSITTAGNSENNNATSANFGSTSNDPPYTKVIWN